MVIINGDIRVNFCISGQNKTESVREMVFRAILSGTYQPGDRIPAEREMANLTDTSRVTVRRAYEALEQAGILQRRQGAGTTIATTRGGHKNDILHVALLTAAMDPFALSYLTALERELSERNALMVLKVTDNQPEIEEAAAIDVVSKGLRNLVIWPSGGAMHKSTFERLRILGVNMVFFDRLKPGGVADYVAMDNDQAVRQQLDRAWKSGIQKIYFLGHSDLHADSDDEREAAYLAWCQEHGIEPKVLRVPYRGDMEAAIRKQRRIWFGSKSSPTLLCINDPVAIAAYRVLGPKTMVYGIDGHPEALALGLPTIQQPLTEMATATVDALYRQQQEGGKWRARELRFKGTIR